MFLSKYRGFYYLYFNDETGNRKKVSCKTKFKPDALKFLSNFKSQSNSRKEIIRILTLSELKKEIVQYVSNNLRIGTVKIYRIVFDNLIRILTDKHIKLITVKDIEFYKSERLKEVRPATVNIDILTLKAIFNIAVRFEWISINPVISVKKLSIPEKEFLSFSYTQLKHIISNIQNTNLKNIVLVGAYTGCRLNEIINLQWNDVNFADRILTIRNKDNFNTKTGKVRNIPLSNDLTKLFNDILKLDGADNILNYFNLDSYIFKNLSGYRYSKNYISMKFKAILRKLNFDEKFHFHCLRHTFISSLIKSGVNINYVREIAGHSEIRTTMNYVHIKTEDLREAMNKIQIL